MPIHGPVSCVIVAPQNNWEPDSCDVHPHPLSPPRALFALLRPALHSYARSRRILAWTHGVSDFLPVPCHLPVIWRRDSNNNAHANHHLLAPTWLDRRRPLTRAITGTPSRNRSPTTNRGRWRRQTGFRRQHQVSRSAPRAARSSGARVSPQ